MKKISLWKRLTAMALSLVLILGVLPLSAGAAGNPPAGYLAGAAYLGDWNRCALDYDAAMGYAKALDSLGAGSQYAVLADPAGDGYPLLITVERNPQYNAYGGTLRVWEWNGTRAVAHNFKSEMELGYLFGFDFGRYQSQPAIRVGDGVSLAVGDAGGSLYYAVKNGRLTLLHHIMYYSAMVNGDGKTAFGQNMPLVNVSSGNVSVRALEQAGWKHHPDDFGGYYSLTKVDGTYYADESRYETIRDSFRENREQIILCSTGEDQLLGTWASGWHMSSALKEYAKARAQLQGGFLDVGPSHYAYEPVSWAVEEKITNGTGYLTFSPDQTCTQGQILTFLWRAVGEPKASISNPFTNAAVTSGQYYYNALLWAYEQGIVTSKALNPNAGCQRSDVVLYLWRLAGSPAAGGAAFSDVSSSAPYAQAVAWAVREGITNGTSATTFSPSQTCTRGQIVTFLYRDMA